MTSREREAIVVRAVEGGLFDDLWNLLDELAADDRARHAEVARKMRARVGEVLGARPRQTKRLMRAAIGAAWRRYDLGDATTLDREAWGELYRALEGRV